MPHWRGENGLQPGIDIERAEKFIDALAQASAFPLFDASRRLVLSHAMAVVALEFAASVRMLAHTDRLLGAAVCLRSQFEALVRAVWLFHVASEEQLEKLDPAQLTLESQQRSKNLPMLASMLDALEQKPQLAPLMVSLAEFRTSSWPALNSFVHAGLHAVHRKRFGYPQALLEQVFRSSNGLCLIAYMHIGILSGVAGIQKDLIGLSAGFASVLPKLR